MGLGVCVLCVCVFFLSDEWMFFFKHTEAPRRDGRHEVRLPSDKLA